MKKIILFSAVALSIAAVVAAAFAGRVNVHELMPSDVEALAAGESTCLSSSSDNTGVCKQAADATGDYCVQSAWFEHNNCYTNVWL